MLTALVEQSTLEVAAVAQMVELADQVAQV
jgi:hypothetical protein